MVLLVPSKISLVLTLAMNTLSVDDILVVVTIIRPIGVFLASFLYVLQVR